MSISTSAPEYSSPFRDLIRSEEQLRELLPPASGIALIKVQTEVDEHVRRYIAASPYVIISTTNAEGHCDASPRGGPPGFVRVVDEKHLFLGEATGNRRADTLTNLLQNPRLGMLFLLPGFEEVLRLNGTAVITTDREFLDSVDPGAGAPPQLGIGIRIEECFLHCAKAALRSNIWNPITWPDLAAFPTAAQIFTDHTKSQIGDGSVQSIQALLETSYTQRL